MKKDVRYYMITTWNRIVLDCHNDEEVKKYLQNYTCKSQIKRIEKHSVEILYEGPA